MSLAFTEEVGYNHLLHFIKNSGLLRESCYLLKVPLLVNRKNDRSQFSMEGTEAEKGQVSRRRSKAGWWGGRMGYAAWLAPQWTHIPLSTLAPECQVGRASQEGPHCWACDKWIRGR